MWRMLWLLEKELTGYLEVVQPIKSRLKLFFNTLMAQVEQDTTLSKMANQYKNQRIPRLFAEHVIRGMVWNYYIN